MTAVCSSLFLQTLIARSQGIHGIISNGKTGEPLQSVNITVSGTRIGSTTDKNGAYRLTGLDSGHYTIEFSMMGFRNHTKNISIAKGQIITLDVKLFPTILHMGSVQVVGEKIRNIIETPRVESSALQTATSIVEHRDIVAQSSVTLIDAMQYVPGAWIESRGRKIKQFFSIRGQKYPYPEYAVNGAWQREFHELPYFFSSYDIQRIEIIRSSAALLTGLSGINGVINIITRQYESPETQINAEYGSFESNRISVSHGATQNNLSYAGSVSLRNSFGPANKNADEKMFNAYGRFKWQVIKPFALDLSVYHFNGERQLSLASFPAANRFQTEKTEFDPYRATLANLRAYYRPSEKMSHEILIFSASRFPQYRVYNADETLKSETTEKDMELGLNWISTISLSNNNTLRFGGLYNTWEAPNGKRFYVGRRTALKTYSAVIVNEHQFRSLTLDGGIRISKIWIDEYGAFNINGSGGKFKTVNPIKNKWEPVIVSANAGMVYYFQNLFSLYSNVAIGQVQPRRGTLNVNLEEPVRESQFKLDLGIKYDFPNGNAAITGFYVNRNNALILSGKIHELDGRIMELYLNRDQDQKGIEGDVRLNLIPEKLDCFVTTVWMQTRFKDDGHITSNKEIPNFILSGGVNFNYRGFDVNAFYKHVSVYESTRFLDTSVKPVVPVSLGDFHVFNATIGWTSKNKYPTRVYIKLQNIFDNHYSTVAGWPDYGRQVSVGLNQSINGY